MKKNVPAVLADIRNDKIGKYVRFLKTADEELNTEDLMELESKFEEELRKITDPEYNLILGGGTYGLVFNHKDPNIVCKIGKFLDLFNEVAGWLYLSNLVTRGLVMALEIKSFHMIPLAENAGSLLEVVTPISGKTTMTMEELKKNKKLKESVDKIQNMFDVIDEEYKDGKFMAFLTEDKVTSTVKSHVNDGKYLDGLFLFEYIYFEYICWKYLGVWSINDSKYDNLGVVENKRPIIYKIEGTMFKFDKGLGFRRIDFGDIFSASYTRPLINQKDFKLMLSDSNLIEKSKLPPPREKFFFDYTFPKYSGESLKKFNDFMINSTMFNDLKLAKFVDETKRTGLFMDDIGRVIKKVFADHIIETLPFDMTNHIFIDADKFSSNKRKMEESTSKPEEKPPKNPTPEKTTQESPTEEVIMDTINNNYSMIASLIPRKKLPKLPK